MMRFFRHAGFSRMGAVEFSHPWADTGAFERTYQVTGEVKVDLRSGAGSVKVRTGQDAGVHVSASIRARNTRFGMRGKEKVRSLEQDPPVRQDGNCIIIGRVEDRRLLDNVAIDYELTVPAQTRLTSHTGAGDQSISGLQLGVTVATGAGDISVDGLGADVHAESGSGSVRLRGVKGSMTAQTGAGDIEAEGVPAGDWKLRTGAGRVDLKFPTHASFDLDVASSLGSVDLKRQVLMKGTIHRSHARGTVGSGGPPVKARTGVGHIRVDWSSDSV